MELIKYKQLFQIKKKGQSAYWSKNKFDRYTSGMTHAQKYQFTNDMIQSIKSDKVHSYDRDFFIAVGRKPDGSAFNKTLIVLKYAGAIKMRQLQTEYFQKPYTLDFTHYFLTGEDLPTHKNKLILKPDKKPLNFYLDLMCILDCSECVKTDLYKNEIANRIVMYTNIGWNKDTILKKMRTL